MSRSLGTLTLDLVARIGGFEQGMDKAARHSQRRMSDVQKSAQRVRRAITGAFAAIGVGLSARAFQNMIRDTARAIDEQAKLAGRLNTTSTELAGLNLAGDLAGVSMNEVSGAARQLDLNIGRAIQGVEAQKQAFDRLGLSAQQLARIPLDERIATINRALNENIPSAERAAVAAQIFGRNYQEAIRQLSPEGLSAAREEVEQFGLAITELEAANVEAMNDSFTRLGLVSQGLRQQITVGIAGPMRAVVEEFLEAAKTTQGFGNVAQTTSMIATNAFGGIGDVVESLQITVLGLNAGLEATRARMLSLQEAVGMGQSRRGLMGLRHGEDLPDFDDVAGAAAAARESADAAAEAYADAFGRRMDQGRFSERMRERMTINDIELQVAGVSRRDPLGLGSVVEEAETVAVAVQSQFESVAQGLRQQIALFGEIGHAAKIRYQVEEGLIEGLTEAQGQYLIYLAEQRDQLDTLAEFAKDVERIIDSTIPAAEKQIASLREDILILSMAFDEGKISAEQYQSAVGVLDQRIEEIGASTQDVAKEMSVFAEQAARNMQDAFAQFLFDPFDGGVRGMLDSFTRMIQQMLSQAIAADLFAMMGMPGAGAGGNVSGIVSAIGGIFGGKFADGGRPDPRKISIVGERGPELFVPDGVSGTVIPNDRIGGRQVEVHQVINVAGRPDNRTALQMASEAARKQRMAARVAG